MRLFCGIEIPNGIQAGLGALEERLKPLAKSSSSAMNWSPAENLHVTTKFIGEWPEAGVDRLAGALAGMPRRGAIEMAIRGLHWFPNVRGPRVLFAGIVAGEELAALAHETEQRLAAVGVPVEEREYRPHLTLARVKAAQRGLVNDLGEDASAEFGSFRAESFFLFLSGKKLAQNGVRPEADPDLPGGVRRTLGARGGQYTKLREFTLL